MNLIFYVSESTQNQNMFYFLVCLLIDWLVVWLVGWLASLGLAREISLTADMI